MKRKLPILGLCALVAVVTAIALSGRGGTRRPASAAHSLVSTQAGRLVLAPDPAGQAKMTLVVDKFRMETNAPATEGGK